MRPQPTRWSLYKRVSPRFSFLIGCFYSTMAYASDLEERACASWRPAAKRRRADTYKVFLAMGPGKPGFFREGW